MIIIELTNTERTKQHRFVVVSPSSQRREDVFIIVVNEIFKLNDAQQNTLLNNIEFHHVTRPDC